MVAVASASMNSNPIEEALIFFSVLLLCIVFAWDGLIRRRILLPSSPLGGGSVAIRGVWAVLVGAMASLVGLFVLFGVLAFTVTAVTQCRGSLACIGGTAQAVEWVAWAWLGGIAAWFVLVWLRLSNPDKHMLVYGVWYFQDKVGQLVLRDLAARGLKPLQTERIYALETTVIQIMRTQHWLVNGKTWLDGGQFTAKDVPIAEMLEVVLHQPNSQQSSKSQRAAIEFLLGYFKTEAQRAEHMSPFHRWLVGTAQIGKRQVYGRRAI